MKQNGAIIYCSALAHRTVSPIEVNDIKAVGPIISLGSEDTSTVTLVETIGYGGI